MNEFFRTVRTTLNPKLASTKKMLKLYKQRPHTIHSCTEMGCTWYGRNEDPVKPWQSVWRSDWFYWFGWSNDQLCQSWWWRSYCHPSPSISCEGIMHWFKAYHCIFLQGNVTSFQLMPPFWRTVAVIEASLNLYVCAAVKDGALPNRTFFHLHSKVAEEVNCDVYETPNVFALSQFILFFADLPHLMKTVCNCLYNSGSGSHSCLMWNDGQYLVFDA